MSGRFVRASKYRHVFGQKAKKEASYENLKISSNAFDANLIKVNSEFIGCCWQASGGGAFAVIPLSEIGKSPDLVPLFRTTATVLDVEFDPFNDKIIASAGDDGKISIWEIPEDYSFHHYVDANDSIKDITTPLKVLSGHRRKVGHLKYNPVAQNILASSSIDYSIKIWNVETGEVIQTLQQKDLITSFDWNYNGTLIATASRDKTLRVWDTRSGELVSEGPGHTGAKSSRVVWLGQSDRIATTGFSKLSDRQIGVWDTTDLKSGPIGGFYSVDLSAGILIPLYDDSTKMLYLAGKGDGNIRYFEFENDELYPLSEYQSTDPQRGFAFGPKRAVNVHENEVLKAYKTCGNDSCVEPISFICPRKGDYFQDDIYPDCASDKPALSAEEWISGKTVEGPILVAMLDLYNGTTPTLKPSSASIPSPAPTKEEPEKAEPVKSIKKEEPKKEAVPKIEASPISSAPPSRASSNVDDLLKNSSSVNNMLDKVNDLSEDESKDTPVDDDDDDDWKVEEKPAVSKKNSKSISPDAEKKITTPPVKVEEKPSEKTVEPSLREEDSSVIEKTKDTPKEEKPPVVEESKSVPKEEETSKPQSKVAGAASGLKQNVEKLSSSVETLELIIEKLVKTGLEKDERLKSLEDKIELLLKK